MKIAVTYENGQVFQHFGHTEQFKVYEIEDGKVVGSQVTGSEGSGHEALAVLLADKAIDVLICGGIGGRSAGGDALHRRRSDRALHEELEQNRAQRPAFRRRAQPDHGRAAAGIH